VTATSSPLEGRLSDFLEEVASPELLPGGGFVSAIAIAMAAGLVSMVARLSSDVWPEAGAAAAQAEALRARVTPLAEQNAQAYRDAVATLKGQGEVAGGRDAAIADALGRAAELPLRIGEIAADVATIAAEVAERGELSLRADAIAAALLAEAGARSAATLVEVNLGTTSSDDRVERARVFAASAEAAAERAQASMR
jgi:methenyltetrahydrofolate cyclohydrolase